MEIALCMWLICGIGAAAIASSKRRSAVGWFFIGVLIGPLALLIVGFMAAPEPAPVVPASRSLPPPSPRPMTREADETPLFVDSAIRITPHKIVYRGDEYLMASLNPVVVSQAGSRQYVIQLYNLMGRQVGVIESPSPAYLEEIAGVINQALGVKPAPAAATPSTVPPTAAPPAASGGERVAVLAELKQMLDGGLITQDEYDAKKAEILARM